MKALVMSAPSVFGVKEVERPKPGPMEVLVNMQSVAICGSDPSLLFGKSLKDGLPGFLPFIPGHEGAGRIAEVGAAVTDLQIGDLVAVEAHLGCGHCINCKTGRYNLCLNFGRQSEGHKQYGFTAQGCYAEYCVFHQNAVHRIPAGLTSEHGAMADTMATALHGMQICGIQPGGTTVIMGCGPVGISAMLLAKAMGSRTILCGRGERLLRGRRMGADEIIDYKNCNVGEQVKGMTDGMGADQVVECAGTAASFSNAISSVKRGGKLAILSMPQKPTYEIDMKAIVWNELSLMGSRGNPNCHDQVLSMMKMGTVNPLPMITHRYPLERMAEAVETFTGHLDGCIKVLIQFPA